MTCRCKYCARPFPAHADANIARPVPANPLAQAASHRARARPAVRGMQQGDSARHARRCSFLLRALSARRLSSTQGDASEEGAPAHHPRATGCGQRAASRARHRCGRGAAITFAEAREAIIKEYEWLGTMPAVIRFCFGIFFGDRLGGAVIYGDEPGENLGVWDRFGFTGRIIALSRGACAHWAHQHAASKLIRPSMELLPAKYKVMTATVDGAAGEVGTIYQAAGSTTSASCELAAAPWSASTARQCRNVRLVASSVRAALGRSRRSASMRPMPRRARYFAFRGSRAEQKQHRSAIADLVRPYPSR